MRLPPAQLELITRMVLAILASGRWPSPEDLRQSIALSDELLGLGALLDVGAETAEALFSVEEWRSKRASLDRGLAPRPKDRPR